MNLKHYLFYQRRLIFTYMFIMTFITIMIWVEPKLKMDISNLLYIQLVGAVLFTFYLISEYFIINKHFKSIQSNMVRKAKTYEQYLFHSMLQKMEQHHQEKITEILQEKKDNLEFMTSWFHDIKTPISVSRLVIEHNDKSDAINSLEEEIDKIEAYVEQALYFVRSDHVHRDYLITEVDLSKVVHSAIRQHSKIFIKKKIQLDLQLIQIDILTDQKWLLYILSQLMTNALKYTANQGKLSISVEEDQKETRLVIEDNGIGISKADIARVFDQGFTGENGRMFGNSTGMGLYLAKKLANKLGHGLTIDSEENKFTAVTIHFPKLTDYYQMNEN
ncbi:sensor histidine kinase [Neobacillus sp.]|uniref:sensor histidine kinase n=1 Tax=Neobacillus sp. TaxID=2675273 RepID=UPI00289E3826|nr:sensor histidine kinase [Neobacillus sp.]